MKRRRRVSLFEHRGQPRKLRAQLLDGDGPLGACGFGTFLRENRIDQRENHLPLTLIGVRESVAHELRRK